MKFWFSEYMSVGHTNRSGSVGRAPARIAGDPGSNPGPDEQTIKFVMSILRNA